MSSSRAFTVLELLVVVATIGVLAALLFPVFATAKAAAKQTGCLSHFRMVSQASLLYQQDYDDYFVPVNHQPGQTPNSRVDRTWVQMLLPYAPSFKIFECPADNSDRPGRETTFDQDLVPGDLYSQYYTASMHSNAGYNFQYLAPIYEQGGVWMCKPKSMNELERPGSMLLFLDSVWSVNAGVPSGGGNWLVSPPCRYELVDDQQVDTIAQAILPNTGSAQSPGTQIYAPTVGWQPQQDSQAPFGGVWPWHNGKSTVTMIDGSARSLTIQQIANGCDVRPQWTGDIYDRSLYSWSPR